MAAAGEHEVWAFNEELHTKTEPKANRKSKGQEALQTSVPEGPRAFAEVVFLDAHTAAGQLILLVKRHTDDADIARAFGTKCGGCP